MSTWTKGKEKRIKKTSVYDCPDLRVRHQWKVVTHTAFWSFNVQQCKSLVQCGECGDRWKASQALSETAQTITVKHDGEYGEWINFLIQDSDWRREAQCEHTAPKINIILKTLKFEVLFILPTANRAMAENAPGTSHQSTTGHTYIYSLTYIQEQLRDSNQQVDETRVPRKSQHKHGNYMQTSHRKTSFNPKPFYGLLQWVMMWRITSDHKMFKS